MEGKLVRTLPAPAQGDPDHVALLTEETVSQGHSVIVFCMSKIACEKVAQQLADNVSVPKPACAAEDEEDGRKLAVEELRRAGRLDGVLATTLPNGELRLDVY